jgi:hypothetical protein
MGIWDWGLGIGDWGLGIGDWAQSPIPNRIILKIFDYIFIYYFKNLEL